MAQYATGTVSVTNGNAVITGNGTLFLANVAVGDLFVIAGQAVMYDVGSVDTDTQLTLTAPYASLTSALEYFAIVRDFTPQLGLPYPVEGDAEVPALIKRSFGLIDTNLYNQGVATNNVIASANTIATASAASATTSANSATASAASATDAATSAATAASTLPAAAAADALAAAASATDSANSATASATSANSSTNSATASATSATNSANSATAAATSEANAATIVNNSMLNNLLVYVNAIYTTFIDGNNNLVQGTTITIGSNGARYLVPNTAIDAQGNTVSLANIL